VIGNGHRNAQRAEPSALPYTHATKDPAVLLPKIVKAVLMRAILQDPTPSSTNGVTGPNKTTGSVFGNHLLITTNVALELYPWVYADT
jgi:hypothetical protein